MIKIKIVVLIFGIIVLLIAAATLDVSKAGSESSLNMEISMEKYEFIEGEFVSLIIKVKNTGPHDDSVEFLNDDFLSKSIIIKSQSGRSTSFKGADLFYVFTPYTKIASNDEVRYEIKLNYLWGFESYEIFEESLKPFANRYFPEDKYSVEVLFKYDGGKKSISSNNISFVVKAPSGVQAQAFKELKDLYKLPFGQSYSEIQNQETILKWVDFMSKYKNTTYFYNAFMESADLRKYRNFKYDSSLVNDCQFIINQKPNTLIARTAINTASSVILKMSGKDDAILFLEKLKTDYPSTESSKWAEKLLESNKFKEN